MACVRWSTGSRGAVLALVLGAVALPAHAAGLTLLGMRSDPGDYIGQGQSYLFMAADGTFTATRNFDNGVSLSFNTPDWSEWWYLDFAAPDAAELTPGVYTGAMRFPFQDPGRPGLSVTGDGRGCNTLTGRFRVYEVQFGAGDAVDRFAASFEQHCEGADPALRGVILFDAVRPAP